MITEEEKSDYEAATTEEKKATLRAEAIANHLSIRASLYNEVTGSYDRTIENATIDDNRNLTGGTIPAVVDATNSYYRQFLKRLFPNPFMISWPPTLAVLYLLPLTVPSPKALPAS